MCIVFVHLWHKKCVDPSRGSSSSPLSLFWTSLPLLNQAEQTDYVEVYPPSLCTHTDIGGRILSTDRKSVRREGSWGYLLTTLTSLGAPGAKRGQRWCRRRMHGRNSTWCTMVGRLWLDDQDTLTLALDSLFACVNVALNIGHVGLQKWEEWRIACYLYEPSHVADFS